MIITVTHEEYTETFYRTLTEAEITFAILNKNINSYSGNTAGKIVKSIENNLNLLSDYQLGNWKIQETMMIFYKRDGTELFRYSLLDQNGLPSNKDVFKRLKL
jgi:hypothetical protein